MCTELREGIGIGLDPGVMDLVRGVEIVGLLGIDGVRLCPEDLELVSVIGADAARSFSALLSNDL